MATYNDRSLLVKREKARVQTPVRDSLSTNRGTLTLGVANPEKKISSNKYTGKKSKLFKQHEDHGENPRLVEERTDEGLFTFYNYKTVNGGLARDAWDEGDAWDAWDE